MAQIVTAYDLSGGSTTAAAGTDVNNMRFQFKVTGATAGQVVHLRPKCSENAVDYFNILNENKDPFDWVIQGDGKDSKQILVIGSANVRLDVYCEGSCTGTLDVYTYES